MNLQTRFWGATDTQYIIEPAEALKNWKGRFFITILNVNSKKTGRVGFSIPVDVLTLRERANINF